MISLTFEGASHFSMDSWLLLKQKQRDELRNQHREQFLLLRSKIKGLESEARIASGGILSLRERQQSLLTSKKYGEAYQQLKVFAGTYLANASY